MFEKIIMHQIRLNQSISENWYEKDWELAIITEAAEAIDSTPWKWWKAQQKIDIENVKLEAIDLLHFVISFGLSGYRKIKSGTEQEMVISIDNMMITAWEISLKGYFIERDNYNYNIKMMLSNLLNYDKPDLDRFVGAIYWLFSLMISLGMSHNNVIELYLAKNLLNEYRQSRGYKDPNANYQKVIGGLEDNVIFIRIIRRLGHNYPNLKETAFREMDKYIEENR